MRKINSIITLTIIFFITSSSNAQGNSQQLIEDFQKVLGNWKGSLTYLDYSSGKPYTMAADIEVKKIDGTNDFNFINTYPKEKSANSTQTITISQDGKNIGKEEVVSRTELPDGQIQIVTQRQGKDGNDNKEALIKQTYTISKNVFSIRKDVLFAEDKKWVQRHEYVYSRD
ncbi:hypothetical protein [Flavobacterium quisquiliarum]|uniref:Uncharacterized protein n=1 Tax=Flavobacterium quisquiliarum TaxID=1834436 RepID=A0ABV8W0F3_9FLAO|nr:hypothetical protein [Flavobacterium quisquiliarum]MBW1654563.1 hypothetical protein [Flavobacterium quisquiliarum]NWL01752.1 hypothetical protein [Flavobacterium collinsii]